MMELLRQSCPRIDFELVTIVPTGDRRKNEPIMNMERGMFAKELETALLDEEIDIAIHSAKDVPASMPKGLILSAFGMREDPRDVLVNRWGLTLDGLPTGARLGTSSPRRQAQIMAYRPDLNIVPIRGNVGTRLRKSGSAEYDGVVLAAAGVRRLGMESEIAEYIEPQVCIPDAGQGALAAEVRSKNSEVIEILHEINHLPTSIAVVAERSFMAAISGGCSVPVAAYGRLEGEELQLSTMAATLDGADLVRSEIKASMHDPESAGINAARRLLHAGAYNILSRPATL